MEKRYFKWLAVLCWTLMLSGLATPVQAQNGVFYSIGFRVFHDSIENCIKDTSELNVPGVKVIMELLPSRRQISGISESGSGYFGLVIFGQPGVDSIMRVYTTGSSNLAPGCTSIFEFQIADQDTAFTVEFPIHAGECSQLGVDISGSPPRPCFDRVYNVRAFNQGLNVAEAAYVDVKLDSNLLFQSSSIPGTPMPAHAWRFPLGNIPALGVKPFTITYQLDCDIPLGQVICSEAAVYPDTVCVPNGGWSGASVLAGAECDGDSIILTIKNPTTIPTTPDLEYIIAEDLIMFRQDMFQLGPLEFLQIKVPANGSTWHLGAQQEPGYPYHVFTNATIEGCGTNQSGGVSTGIFLNYPYASGQVNRSEDCQEAVSSFDPNDKQAFPRGYGLSHFIRAGDEIKYVIRFQNTGNDTAYTVAVREPLPAGLDPNSVVPGSASHTYSFSTDQHGEMVFYFPKINLPDSLTNPEGSGGYLSYKARSFADLPDGSLISGAAKIYFDFNPPIVTNTVFHTIGEDFITVAVTDVWKPGFALSVFPNPGTDVVHFSWDNKYGKTWQINLMDVLGKSVKIAQTTGNLMDIPCNNLPPGIYYFQMNVENKATAAGKIIVK